MKIKKIHPLQWVFESLEDHPSFHQKKMFGCEAAYYRGRLTLVLASGEEPWNGLLVCTSREHHAELLGKFPALRSHPVLGKWLYLSQSDAEFEATALSIVERVRAGDPRIGVESKPKKASLKKR